MGGNLPLLLQAFRLVRLTTQDFQIGPKTTALQVKSIPLLHHPHPCLPPYSSGEKTKIKKAIFETTDPSILHRSKKNGLVDRKKIHCGGLATRSCLLLPKQQQQKLAIITHKMPFQILYLPIMQTQIAFLPAVAWVVDQIPPISRSTSRSLPRLLLLQFLLEHT